MIERVPLGSGLGGQRIELFDWGEAFCPFLPYRWALLQHVHELDAGPCALGRFKRLEPQHGMGAPLQAAMVLLNGMITKDKICLIRHCQVQLRWSRQPYRQTLLSWQQKSLRISLMALLFQRRSLMGLKQRLLEPHRAAGYINLVINASSM